MRIIAGEYRRRNLFSPPGDTTRPIPDRVKESLFSMLGKRLEGAAVLDCFAGSGAIGLEALSRGASSCIFVEKDRHSADVLEKNIAMLKCEDRATVVRGDALGLSVIARCPQPLDLAFFDPPYPLIQTSIGWRRVTDQCLAVSKILSETGFVILRTPVPHVLQDPAVVGVDAHALGDRTRKYKKHKKPRHNKFDAYDPEPTGLEAESRAADDELTDEEFAEMTPEVAETPATPPPISTPASHEIAGMRGPETHIYGTMAVHFYMRAKE